jgi:serine/threonine protein kinase/formylglycine-generating enzyme required for sulfatase activity
LEPDDAKSYLREARAAANLDHPHVVSVHDVGSTDEIPCYIVSKYFEGGDLAARIKRDRPSFSEAAELVATVAGALGHAHQQGFIHRDVKPGNILLDTDGHAYVTDFGLAIHESVRRRHQGERVGTPHYMSPEQVRGESHRLDGRCDIWGLGVIFYELLVGRRPFAANEEAGLYDQILFSNPQPLRQLNPQIPAELERICLKCLAKRMSERYTTASDLVDDLRQWLAETRAPSESHAERVAAVVPKGLRSFDNEDADFYLQLLPGPRDRHGLPDSIRFWKTRIEQTDPDRTFPVGLIYGPSGSGKSSFVKAGLLTHLSNRVEAIYVEATSQETELRLLKELRKRHPEIPKDLALHELCASLREGAWLAPGCKILIILDQFEQWLHATERQEESQLLQALRQCDGGHLQCLIMVRDDFWMAATRFLHALEIELVQSHNVAAVDRFDLRHAKKVLTLFGQAYAALPENAADLTHDHDSFLDRSVEALASNGRVVSVRLALFADMLRDKPWTPAALKAAGGAEGIGVAFLDEAFSSSGANPRFRMHARAAQSVLKTLLPVTGVDIKGNRKSYAELLEASRYAERKKDFDELIRILDSELRLITPADPIGVLPDGSVSAAPSGHDYFELTHDYLIPALREWLSREQRQSRQGRAEIRLAERTVLWTNKPEHKQLPSLGEWLSIRFFTRTRDWSQAQRRMMRVATRHHVARVGIVLALLVAVVVSATMLRDAAERRTQVRHFANLADQLWNVDLQHLSPLLDQLDEHPELWRDDVARIAARSPAAIGQRTRGYLALARHGEGELAFLTERLLAAGAEEHLVIREELKRRSQELLPVLWNKTQKSSLTAKEVLCAASALAAYDPASENWHPFAGRVASALLKQDPLVANTWVEALRPVQDRLVQPVLDTFRDPNATNQERLLAASIIANYGAADESLLPDDLLARLLMDADATQFSILYPVAHTRGPRIAAIMAESLKDPVSLEPTPENETRLQRQANAAESLLRLQGGVNFWPLLKRTADPRLRTLLIERIYPAGIAWEDALARCAEEKDPAVRQAIILGLDACRLSEDQRSDITARLLRLYESDPDATVHAATEWLLRRWKCEQLESVTAKLAGKAADNRTWFVNGQSQTMVVIDAPARFTMGSAEYEVGRDKNETRREVSIDRAFAMSAHEVTVGQFLQFQPEFAYDRAISPEAACPINMVSWYDAVKYCRWLSEREPDISEDEMCYPPLDRIGPEMKLPANYRDRKGYRLPTDAEWEYAVRAGSETSRFFGNDASLLAAYAWYSANAKERTRPVGQLKPNTWGLFDVYGNAGEWCHNSDAGDARDQAIRGGDYRSTPKFLRSAMPSFVPSETRYSILGFRLVKTLAPSRAEGKPSFQ